MTSPGVWRVEYYQSGSVVVSSGKTATTKFGIRGVGPHIGIHYALGRNVDDETRLSIAEKIAAALNDGVGLSAARLTESTAVCDGVEFSAIGPYVDSDPPNCNWKEDDSEAGVSARARLMDSVFGIGRSA